MKASRLAYLGPEGTFAEEALSSVKTIDVNGLETCSPMRSVQAVISSIEAGTFDYGLVPIENSVDGEVMSTLDALVFATSRCLIREEVILPVSFTSLRRVGDTSPPRVAISHPAALGQCRSYIESRSLEERAVASTAEACRIVAGGSETGLVAIASSRSGLLHGLETAEERIEDFPGASTRFALLSRELSPLAGSENAGSDVKTFFVLTPPEDRTGILADMLKAFSDRGLGLASITSRPLRSALGTYCFLLEVRAGLGSTDLIAAMKELSSLGCAVKYLGTYAAFEGERVTTPFAAGPAGSLPPGDPASVDALASRVLTDRSGD